MFRFTRVRDGQRSVVQNMLQKNVCMDGREAINFLCQHCVAIPEKVSDLRSPNIVAEKQRTRV